MSALTTDNEMDPRGAAAAACRAYDKSGISWRPDFFRNGCLCLISSICLLDAVKANYALRV